MVFFFVHDYFDQYLSAFRAFSCVSLDLITLVRGLVRLVSSANEKVGKEEANVFAKVVIRYYVDEEERDRLVDFCKKNEISIQVPDEPKKEF